MNAGVATATITGAATTFAALIALAGVIYTARARVREARAQAATAEQQLADQAGDAERDDAARLLELANRLAGEWITRLSGEVERVHHKLGEAEQQIAELTARVEHLTAEVHASRAERGTLRAERDAARAHVAVLLARLEQHGIEPNPHNCEEK